MTITFVLQTDGRPYMTEAVANYTTTITGTIDHWIMFDDSGDQDHRNKLRTSYPDWEILWPADERVGYTPMRQFMWRHLSEHCTTSHIANFEDDFMFGYQDEPRGPVTPLDHPVDLAALVAVLDGNPHLANMAFLRSEYYHREIEGLAGNKILGRHRATYRNRNTAGHRWIEHKNYFTVNPCIHATELCHRGWPDGRHTETGIGKQLVVEGRRFAHWGWTDDPRILHHIGHHREGFGY